jgi:hypothetical protein
MTMDTIETHTVKVLIRVILSNSTRRSPGRHGGFAWDFHYPVADTYQCLSRKGSFGMVDIVYKLCERLPLSDFLGFVWEASGLWSELRDSYSWDSLVRYNIDHREH